MGGGVSNKGSVVMRSGRGARKVVEKLVNGMAVSFLRLSNSSEKAFHKVSHS